MNPESSSVRPLPRHSFSRFGSVVLFIFGAALPVVTLVFEWVTGGCAELLFDPIPSWLHGLLVAWVPLALGFTVIRTWNPTTVSPPWYMPALVWSAMAISLVYAVYFLPVTPIAALGILYLGIGFLPLTPLIACVASIFLAVRLSRWSRTLPPGSGRPAWKSRAAWWGFAAGLGLMGLAEVPRLATRAGVEMVASRDAAMADRGLWLLRTLGSKELLRGACTINSRRGAPFAVYRTRLGTEETRRLFYRVFGEPFNTKPADRRSSFWGEGRQNSGWDRDLGGTQVGQRLRDVILTSSRLDGVLYPEAGSGYVEWTMIFRNDHPWRDREARLVLQPPGGGVVSRVTLWVNGEPREAAFGKTAQVREAYESVAVRQRRDPLLVTSLGPDQVLAQCFPIPADGGEMKIRIGMSFPLESSTGAEAFAALPQILDRNFLLKPGLETTVWYEGPGGMTYWTKKGKEYTAAHDLHFSVLEKRAKTGMKISIGAASAEPLVASSPVDRQSFRVEQSPVSHPTDGVTLAVIDGSRHLQPYLPDVYPWLEQRETMTLWLAGDGVKTFTGPGAEAARWLRRQRFVGGQDSVPALEEAIAQAMERRGSGIKTIWWFYGGQAAILENPDRLQRFYERGDPGVAIVACPLGDTVNRLREVPPLAYAPTARAPDFAVQRVALESIDGSGNGEATAGREHLFRAIFAETVRRQLADAFARQAAMKPSAYRAKLDEWAERASFAQIVTPVSGAVVLETQQQYDEHDLAPADPDTVPNVPEPTHAALAIGALLLAPLAWRLWARRSA